MFHNNHSLYTIEIDTYSPSLELKLYQSIHKCFPYLVIRLNESTVTDNQFWLDLYENCIMEEYHKYKEQFQHLKKVLNRIEESELLR